MVRQLGWDVKKTTRESHTVLRVSEKDESQAFGLKQESFMEEVILELDFKGWVKVCCLKWVASS